MYWCGVLFVFAIMAGTIFFIRTNIRSRSGQPKGDVAVASQRTIEYQISQRNLTGAGFDNIFSLFNNIADSISKDRIFSPEMPNAAMIIYKKNDSVGISLEYYLDCGCPGKPDQIDLIYINLRYNSQDVFSPMTRRIIVGVPVITALRFRSEEKGGEP